MSACIKKLLTSNKCLTSSNKKLLENKFLSAWDPFGGFHTLCLRLVEVRPASVNVPIVVPHGAQILLPRRAVQVCACACLCLQSS